MIRRTLCTVLTALGVLTFASRATAQDRFAAVEMKATHVAGSVYMLEGAGGNIGVSVGSDGILIVDDQFAELADKIRAALGALGEGRLRFILNTHYHGDHVGANPVFGPEATIIAHDNVRRRLSEPQAGPGGRAPMDPSGLPVITFDASLSVHFNGEEIRMLHVPHGHTDGDSVIFFTGSNVVHMGDQMFSGRFPYVDLDAGGDVEGYARNIAQVLAQIAPGSASKIIPGHGPLSRVEDLEALRSMVEETTAIVRGKIEQGKDLETIQGEGLPAKWAGWSWGFIDTARWIESVYASLSRE